MSLHTLTIDDIDSALLYAEAELTKAKEAAEKAVARQKRWMTEVDSLFNLKKLRMEEQPEPPISSVKTKSESPATSPAAQVPTAGTITDTEISHIDWIERAVIASGNKGITPPEVLVLAGKEGKLMHRNYPYTALRNLVEGKRITKNGTRYYKPDLQFGLALAG